MIERKTVSQCVLSDYCKGWNDAADAMQKWFSVDEMRPENGEWVLAYCAGYANWFCLNKWCGDCWLNHMPVTHWMPLPQPPKEVE